MTDVERSCHPRSHRTNENFEEVENVLHSDRLLSMRAMAVQLNLNTETVTYI
jgi:DNA-binding transcriptional regulator YhcF (GntR family)